MKDVIATIIKFSVAGAQTAVTALSGVGKAASVTTHAMSVMATSIGSIGGPLAKATSQVANFIFSIKQMGAMGGIIAGVQMLITQISDAYIKAADKMVAKAREAYDAVNAKIDAMNKARMDRVKSALEEVTVKAQRTAQAFETAAAAYMKLEGAKSQLAQSGSNAAIAGLSLERSMAMAGAANENDRAAIGASYDEKIARAKYEAVKLEQSASVESAKKEIDVAEDRERIARKTDAAAQRALRKAQREYDADLKLRDMTGDDRNLAASGANLEAAKKAAAEARNNLTTRETDTAVARSKLIQAEDNQAAALDNARREVVDAESAAHQLAQAQRAAADAELAREKAAADAAEAARRKAAADERQAALDDQRNLAAAESTRWQGEFERAFDLWRDPDAAKQAVDADIKRGEDLKRFRKEVNRYGGQYRIDEYAQLMRAGDEEGMQERLAEWRKSSRFTPQVEQMVKAAAAEQNKGAAEKSLAAIEKNTADLAKKIDDLLRIK